MFGQLKLMKHICEFRTVIITVLDFNLRAVLDQTQTARVQIRIERARLKPCSLNPDLDSGCLGLIQYCSTTPAPNQAEAGVWLSIQIQGKPKPK